MKSNIVKLVKNFLFLAFLFLAIYFSFLYYKSYNIKNKIPEYTQKSKDANKADVEYESAQNTKVATNNYTDNYLGEKQRAKEEKEDEKNETSNIESPNIDDYLKIVKILSNIIHNIYEDRDFIDELNALRSYSYLIRYQSDFEILDSYRIKFLSNANKDELIFPNENSNENLSFLSELIKIEKLNTNKVIKDAHLKNAILVLRKIEDEILSRDFIKKFFDTERNKLE